MYQISLGVRHQAFDRMLIASMDAVFTNTKMAFTLSRFLSQDMAQMRLLALKRAIRGFFEPLCSTAIGFHLRHLLLLKVRMNNTSRKSALP